MLTGAWLQLNGVAGYSALDGGRYAGIGMVGLGVFVAGLLLAAGVAWPSGCRGAGAARRWRWSAAAGVVVVGSPYLGADAAGAVALTAGVCVARRMATGGWLTFPGSPGRCSAGLVVTTGFALLDLRRPPEQRAASAGSSPQLQDGTAGWSCTASARPT